MCGVESIRQPNKRPDRSACSACPRGFLPCSVRHSVPFLCVLCGVLLCVSSIPLCAACHVLFRVHPSNANSVNLQPTAYISSQHCCHATRRPLVAPHGLARLSGLTGRCIKKRGPPRAGSARCGGPRLEGGDELRGKHAGRGRAVGASQKASRGEERGERQSGSRGQGAGPGGRALQRAARATAYVDGRARAALAHLPL